MSNVIVVIGAGSIGQAIARRVSAGKRVLLADLRKENAAAAAEVLKNAGFEVSTATIDVSSRESVHDLAQTAAALGDVNRSHPRRRRLALASVPGDHPRRRSVRHRGGARGVRQCHRSRRPRGEGYRRMIELCPVGRAGTPDEVGNVGALLMGPDGAFITGSDFLMDGGVTASYWFGDLAPK